MDPQVANRNCRQIELQRLPTVAAIVRNVRSFFRPAVEQTFSSWIFANDARNRVVRQTTDDLLPGLPGVARSINVRMQIIAAGGDNVSRVAIVRRSFDQSYAAVRGQFSRRADVPRRAVITRELHEPVAGANPKLSGFGCGRSDDLNYGISSTRRRRHN